MGDKKQTTTSRSDPYAAAAPLLNKTAGILDRYLADPRSTAVYQGPRTVAMSDRTRGGLDALAGNRGYDQSRDYLSRTLSGEFADAGNPHLAKLQDSVRSSVMPGLNASFARSGMIGSTMHQGTLARALTDGMAAPLFQNYEAERGRQDRAAQLLPEMDRRNAQDIIAAGQSGEGYDRERIAADMALFNEQRDAPIRAAQLAYPIASDMGSRFGTQTQTTRSKSNPWEIAAGVGMMGLSVMTGRLGGLGGLGMMGQMKQYGMQNWINAGGPSFYLRNGFASPGQRA